MSGCCDGGAAADVMEPWLCERLSRKARQQTPVCVSVATEQVFFTTLADRNEQEEVAAEDALTSVSGQAWRKESATTAALPAKLPGAERRIIAA